MESLLKGLFDFQRFARNKELQDIIDETSKKYDSTAFSLEEQETVALEIDALETVSAAGDPFVKESTPSGGTDSDP